MSAADYTAHEDLVAAKELRAEIRAALRQALAAIKADAREISIGVDGAIVRIGIGKRRIGRGAPKIWMASRQSLVYVTPRLLNAIAREAEL
jgi:hypothetical protein